MKTTQQFDYYNDIDLLLSELKSICNADVSASDEMIDITSEFAFS